MTDMIQCGVFRAFCPAQAEMKNARQYRFSCEAHHPQSHSGNEDRLSRGRE